MRAVLSFVYRNIKFFEGLLTSVSAALLILCAVFLCMNSPYNFILEETFARGTSLAEDIFKSDNELAYNIDDILFIDVSGSNALLEQGRGNQVIADRSKLDTLFQILRQPVNQKQVVVCDLYFDVSSAQDSSLQATMSAIPNLISTVKTGWSRDITPNVIRAGATGVSGFRNLKEPFLLFSNSLLKFSLTDPNCIKSVPLLIYEKVNGQGSACFGDALHMGTDWYFNTVLIKEQLSREVAKAVYEDQVIPIQRLIDEAKARGIPYLNALGKKKFIMIGNFEKDIHKTTFGDRPGPLVLFDIFLSLQQRENRISTLWLITAICFFTFLCYKKFYHVHLFGGYTRWIDDRMKVLGFKRPLDFNWLIMYGFVLFSAVFFKVYLEYIAALVFFYVFAWSRIYVKTRRIRWMQLRKNGVEMGPGTLFSLLFRKPGFKH